MECTGRGMRTCSAGLLGLLLAMAVLLAIVLLDGQPARAQAESGSKTGYGKPLDRGVDLKGDNLDDSLSHPAPLTETKTFQAAENDARQLLQDMDKPLAPMVLAQRMADARSGADRSGGERPAGTGTDTTPDWAQVTVQGPQTRDDDLARNQADPQPTPHRPGGPERSFAGRVGQFLYENSGLQRAHQYYSRIRTAPSPEFMSEQLTSYHINNAEAVGRSVMLAMMPGQWADQLAESARSAAVGRLRGEDAPWDRVVSAWDGEGLDLDALAKMRAAWERAGRAGEAAWAFPAQSIGQHMARIALNGWSMGWRGPSAWFAPGSSEDARYRDRIVEDVGSIAHEVGRLLPDAPDRAPGPVPGPPGESPDLFAPDMGSTVPAQGLAGQEEGGRAELPGVTAPPGPATPAPGGAGPDQANLSPFHNSSTPSFARDGVEGGEHEAGPPSPVAVLGDDPDTNSPQMVLNASVEPGPFDGTPGTGADGTDAAGPTVAGLDVGETALGDAGDAGGSLSA
jgi:hypothetical protein